MIIPGMTWLIFGSLMVELLMVNMINFTERYVLASCKNLTLLEQWILQSAIQ